MPGFVAWNRMLDVFYVAVTIGFFVVCWFITKACEKL